MQHVAMLQLATLNFTQTQQNQLPATRTQWLKKKILSCLVFSAQQYFRNYIIKEDSQVAHYREWPPPFLNSYKLKEKCNQLFVLTVWKILVVLKVPWAGNGLSKLVIEAAAAVELPETPCVIIRLQPKYRERRWMPVSHQKMDTFDRKCIQAFLLLLYRILHITEILLQHQ